MNINDLLEDVKKLNGRLSNKVISSVIKLSVPDDNNKYDGTFESFYNAVKSGVVKLITVDDRISGFSYDAKAPTIEEDNKECWLFSQAYKGKPMEYYTYAASLLVTGNLIPEKIVEDENELYIYLGHGHGKVIDGYGNVIVSMDPAELHSMLYTEDIIQKLDALLEAEKESTHYGGYDDFDNEDDLEDEDQSDYIYYDNYEDEEDHFYYDDYDEDDEDDDIDTTEDRNYCQCESENRCSKCSKEDCEDEKRLPTSVYFLKDRFSGSIDTNTLKNYLRDKYGHYLAKDCKLEWEEDIDGISIKNIKWGRKK